jgi:hypothetical protein
VCAMRAIWREQQPSGLSVLPAWLFLSLFFLITGVGIRLLAGLSSRKFMLGFLGPALSMFVFILLTWLSR